MTLKILLCWKFSSEKIDLSSMAVTDLQKYLKKLCQGAHCLHTVMIFCSALFNNTTCILLHFSTTRIICLKFFRDSEYSGKSYPRFEQKEEVMMTMDFMANGHWLWFASDQPSVSHSSVVSSVSQADEVTGKGSSPSSNSDASQKTLSTPGDVSLALILQAIQDSRN